MRCQQPAGQKGSLRWIQAVVGHAPQLLSDAVRAAAAKPSAWGVRWVSPLESDDWAEYRDADFLAIAGAGHLRSQLEAFWPTVGPQWDALGISTDGGVVLVEAKAHLSELASSCQASAGSLTKINAAIAAAKLRFSVPNSADWLNGYYQYANRLAHLHFFEANRVPVQLAFVYFVNDHGMKGPATSAEWKAHLTKVYDALGLKSPPPGVSNIFIDVGVAPPTLAV